MNSVLCVSIPINAMPEDIGTNAVIHLQLMPKQREQRLQYYI